MKSLTSRVQSHLTRHTGYKTWARFCRLNVFHESGSTLHACLTTHSFLSKARKSLAPASAVDHSELVESELLLRFKNLSSAQENVPSFQGCRARYNLRPFKGSPYDKNHDTEKSTDRRMQLCVQVGNISRHSVRAERGLWAHALPKKRGAAVTGGLLSARAFLTAENLPSPRAAHVVF